MDLILKIITRISELGYSLDFFPEIRKILNILENSSDGNLKKVNGEYVQECSRRAYELGIMDEQLDSLLDDLYQKIK